jgi:hypothetical protein
MSQGLQWKVFPRCGNTFHARHGPGLWRESFDVAESIALLRIDERSKYAVKDVRWFVSFFVS